MGQSNRRLTSWYLKGCLSVTSRRLELADCRPTLVGQSADGVCTWCATQAHQISAAASPKCDRHGHVRVSAVLQDTPSHIADAQAPQWLWRHQGESGKLAAGADRDGFNALALAGLLWLGRSKL